jgi:sigma-B regulation protein RsbU (phosphoserine phosphatase)
MFVTVFYGVLDPETGALTYCNAGHNPPHRLGASGQDADFALGRTGMALGVVGDMAWEQSVVQLEPGEALLIYTDGVTDAQGAEGTMFGVERLLSAAEKQRGASATEVQDSILEAIREFVGDADPFDDITLMVLLRE